MDGRVLLLAFAGLVGAVFFLGGRSFELPELPIAAGQMVPMGGLSSQGPIDRSDPNSYVTERAGSMKVNGPVAATEHLTAAFIGKVLDGHRSRGASGSPVALIPFEPHGQCRFTRPAAGSRVVNLVARGNDLDTHTYFYTDEDVRKRTESFLKTYRAKGTARVAVSPGSFEMDGLDIAVSETAFPVHLVLHANAKTLWHVHLRPGARVSGVSVLGGDAVAIAGLPSGTPVEVLLQSQLAGCKISPVTQPLVNPVFLSSVEMGVISKAEAEAKIARWRGFERDYDRWFKGQFGIPASTTRIGYQDGNVVLVGPLPADETELVPYTPLLDKTVLVATTGHVMTGSASDFRDLLRGKVTDLAAEISGGDLDAVRVGGN